MSETSFYKWYCKKNEIEDTYVKYKLIAFTTVLFVELFIAVYLKTYGGLPPSDQILPVSLLFIALGLNFLMLFLNYDANPEYVEEGD